MVRSKEVKSKYNLLCTSSFRFYIRDKDMSFHCVVHYNMKPIDVDELFKRGDFNNETYSTLKVNAQTKEPIDAEDITSEYCLNYDNFEEKVMLHPEVILITHGEVNDETEEPIDAEDRTE